MSDPTIRVSELEALFDKTKPGYPITGEEWEDRLRALIDRAREKRERIMTDPMIEKLEVLANKLETDFKFDGRTNRDYRLEKKIIDDIRALRSALIR